MEDVWVVKIKNTGALEWRNLGGIYNYDEAKSIIQTTDGSAVAGSTLSMMYLTGIHGEKMPG